jgi:hypothetical protein
VAQPARRSRLRVRLRSVRFSPVPATDKSTVDGEAASAENMLVGSLRRCYAFHETPLGLVPGFVTGAGAGESDDEA